MEFVNQSAAQPMYGEPDLHQKEQFEFAEKLGVVNQRYQSVSSSVAEHLKQLELEQVKWEQYEHDVNALNNWFTDQEAKVEKYHHIGHEITVQHALKESKVDFFFQIALIFLILKF